MNNQCKPLYYQYPVQIVELVVEEKLSGLFWSCDMTALNFFSMLTEEYNGFVNAWEFTSQTDKTLKDISNIETERLIKGTCTLLKR